MACNVKFCVSVVLNEKRGSVLNPNSVKSTDLNSFCVHNLVAPQKKLVPKCWKKLSKMIQLGIL